MATILVYQNSDRAYLKAILYFQGRCKNAIHPASQRTKNSGPTLSTWWSFCAGRRHPPAGTNALHQITVLLFVAMSGMIMRLRKAVVLSLLFKFLRPDLPRSGDPSAGRRERRSVCISSEKGTGRAERICPATRQSDHAAGVLSCSSRHISREVPQCFRTEGTDL